MTILIPQPAIVARWNGALELRLRRSPLERFLRSRSLPFTARGPGQVTDNVITATVAIVSGGQQCYSVSSQQDALVESQLQEMALIACAISEELAVLIDESASWRLAALVSAAQVLRPHLGLSASAHVSAATARAFEANGHDPTWSEVRRLSAATVEKSDDSRYRAASARIAEHLTAAKEAPTRISTVPLPIHPRRGLCRPRALR